MKRSGHIKLRHVIPSIVTVFAICAGLTSVRMSLEGHLESALFFILLAVLLDGADGKLARFLDAASLFGAELDTLADFFNFGIAPGVLLYNTLYIATPDANVGWLATMVLAVCCALRLARFNLAMKDEKDAPTKTNHFVGVPAPMLACLALMPIFLHLQGWQVRDYAFLCAIYTIGVGLLAVSTLPTFSVKHTSIKRSQLPLAFVLAIILVTCLLVYPWPTLIMANVLYLATIPFSYLSHRRRSRQVVTDR